MRAAVRAQISPPSAAGLATFSAPPCPALPACPRLFRASCVCVCLVQALDLQPAMRSEVDFHSRLHGYYLEQAKGFGMGRLEREATQLAAALRSLQVPSPPHTHASRGPCPHAGHTRQTHFVFFLARYHILVRNWVGRGCGPWLRPAAPV